MGIYLNPKNTGFRESINSQIYIDKSGLIANTNKMLGTEQKYICVSRPRRFGKSMAAKMLIAYYSKGCNSLSLFESLAISSEPSFQQHLNQYNVLFLNMQYFLCETHDIKQMIAKLQEAIRFELLEEYRNEISPREETLPELLSRIHEITDEQFIFIIDEWDCIFREKNTSTEGHQFYLDFLRNLLKDRSYVILAYMTGILPIKKYGSHSALNMFTEFSMTNPRTLAEYVGFTEEEVRTLCNQYHMDFTETARWYDGYTFRKTKHIYSPKSVVDAMLNEEFDSYWTQTETYEALRIYIDMNFDGLKNAITHMLAGERIRLNTATFENDMTTFRSKDDVLTLLIHLGYLAYDARTQEAFIPNYEVSLEFCNALQGSTWEPIIKAIQTSDRLLKATWEKDSSYVAQALENAHLEISILTFNNEKSLACTISLAYYSAKVYYTEIRELPTGNGFADIVFLPRKNHSDKPAILIELKWDKTAKSGIEQIKKQKYTSALDDYSGNILLVAINYNKHNKLHECIIEEIIKP